MDRSENEKDEKLLREQDVSVISADDEAYVPNAN